MLTVSGLKADVPGSLAAATDDEPVFIRRYNDPYRAVVPIDWYRRAAEALREKEAAEQRQQGAPA